MKKILKELIVLFVQLFMFYIFPLFAGPTDAIGMVFLIIVATFVLSVLIGSISKEMWKYFYPAVIALLFIPSIPIYYNESALMHAIWYLTISVAGVLIGAIMRRIIKG